MELRRALRRDLVSVTYIRAVWCRLCVQEDDSVLPASSRLSEADSDDVLEALIQSELLKFQQQQAEKYTALLSGGQAFLPLASPAPGQQLLRVQQKQQEAPAGAALQETYDACPLP